MSIVIGGDVVSENGAIHNNAGFNSLKQALKNLVNEKDVFCINLEGAISPSTQYRLSKIGPCTTNDKSIIEEFKVSNHFMVTLANNHMLDFGKAGLNETCNYLQSADICIIGAQTTEQSNYIYDIREVDDQKVAFIAFAEEEFNREGNVGAYVADYREAYLLVNYLLTKVDKIIAQYHGGIEHTETPTPSQRSFCKFLLDIGCDVVVGHHSHCIGCVEEYNGKYIIYSVGNLYFPKASTDALWRKGALIRIAFQDNGQLCIALAEISYSADNISVTNTDWANIESWLAKNENFRLDDYCYPDKWQKLSAKMETRYMLLATVPTVFRGIFRASIFLRIKSYFFGRMNRLLKLNLYRCSSHRDLVIDILKRNK